jgi:hypothetical protein
MDGCDARHNEELLLCTIDRFVMAITAAEVVAWPALVSSSTAQSLPCGCVGAKCNPRWQGIHYAICIPHCNGARATTWTAFACRLSYDTGPKWKHLQSRSSPLASGLPLQRRCRLATQSSSSASDPQLVISGVYSRKRVRCSSVPALAALHANIGTSLRDALPSYARERITRS